MDDDGCKWKDGQLYCDVQIRGTSDGVALAEASGRKIKIEHREKNERLGSLVVC